MSELSENIVRIEQSLLNCWSIKTSSKWTSENPYKGQCGVTALVINDFFGGEILKTEVENQWHFYNRIAGKRYDFTVKQFNIEINYQDFVSNRDEAFTDTNKQQYSILKDLMNQAYKNAPG